MPVGETGEETRPSGATSRTLAFPPGFRFGTSTASYQIEGAASSDGKGPSIWDTFTAKPGTVIDGSSGVQACDHYHRYREDVALMKRLGANGYRFSISWPRIQASGKGRPNPKGLAFYDRLIDELLAAGVQPMATLYHWDLPQALEDDGGWLNRSTVDAFAEYAAIVGDRYGDRVEHWVPINEPNVVTIMGYGIGMHAPGHALMFDALPVAHHLLLAHGRAAIALRESVRGRVPSIGCANNHAPIWPASDDEADVGASKLFDAMWNGMFIEPMLVGRYPVDMFPLVEHVVKDGDMPTIRQPLDFYGVNYYNPMRIAATEEDSEMPFEFREVLGYEKTDFGWPIVPGRPARVADHAARPVPRRAAADHDHRVRVRLQRRARRERRGRRPEADRLPGVPPRCRRRPPSSAASTSVATTAGRSWTTSSGPRATPSASAWSTSTTRPSSGPPSGPSTGTPT